MPKAPLHDDRASDPAVIRVRGLTKKFGSFTAVDDITFSIRGGEILGFLGPNGAGKTTTIKMMTGLLRITSGEVRVQGMDIRRNLRRIKPLIGYMSQKFSLYPLLTGFENLEFFGGISGLSAGEIHGHKQTLADLVPEKVLRQKTGDVPPGIRQQVALYTCLMPDPEIILLDEPTSGVDPENRRRFWTRIYELKTAGKTVLVTTHNLDEAEFADRILIIHRGRIIREGDPSALREQAGAESMEDLFKQAITEDEKT